MVKWRRKKISKEADRMNLSIAQMVLGALIVGSLVAFTGWVEPGFYHIKLPPEVGSNIPTEILLNPGWNIPMMTWRAVSFVLGLSVLGCGIAQYLKARKVRINYEATP